MKEIVLGGGGIRSSLLFQAAAASTDGRVVVYVSSTHLDVVIDGVRRTVTSARLEGATRACAVSADGLWVACAGSAVVLVDPSTLDVLRTIPLPAYCVEFSPDGALLACGGKIVSLVDPKSGAVVRELRGSRRAVVSLAFDKTGARLACGGDTKIRVFDVAKGKKLHELEAKSHVQCAFSGDSLVTAGPKSQVSVWDFATATRHDVEPELWATSALTALADGTVAMCGEELMKPPELRVLGGTEWLSREPLMEVRGASAIVRRGEDFVIVGDGVPAAEVHRGGALIATVGHTDGVTAIASKGRLLASASRDGTAIIWDRDKRAPLARIEIASPNRPGLLGRDKATAVALSVDGKKLAIGTEGGKVAIASLDGTIEHVFAAQDVGHVIAVTFSSDGRLVASGNDRMLNNVPKLRVHTLAGDLVADVRSEYFPRELRFVEGSQRSEKPGELEGAKPSRRDQGAVEILTIQACARVELSADAAPSFRRHDLGYILSGVHASSADGTTIADGTHKELHVWSTATGKTTLQLERSDLSRIALSSDGSKLAIAQWGREAIDIVGREGEVIATVPWGSWLPPSALAFGDDRTLFCGAEDGAIVVFPL